MPKTGVTKNNIVTILRDNKIKIKTPEKYVKILFENKKVKYPIVNNIASSSGCILIQCEVENIEIIRIKNNLRFFIGERNFDLKEI